MSGMRAINLGLPRSGTTTFAHALREAGLQVADHRIRRSQTAREELKQKFLADALYEGYFQTGDPWAQLDEFDAISDISVLREGRTLWPQSDWGLLTALREARPEMRFVATRRDSFEISQSMLRWADLGLVRVPGSQIPGLPEGFGETTAERMRWIEAHYGFLRAIFAGSDRFLELDVAAPDAKERLGAFLGLELPWWGRRNSRREED